MTVDIVHIGLMFCFLASAFVCAASDYEDSPVNSRQIPIELLNALNEEAIGTLTFKTTKECPDNKQKYGPLAAGSKTTVMISSLCHIIKITAHPNREDGRHCYSYSSNDRTNTGSFTISTSDPKYSCTVTALHNEVNMPVEFSNCLNKEIRGTIIFQDTELCPDNKQNYGPWEQGSKNTFWISSFCHIIKITAGPTKPDSQKCTAFISKTGIQKGPITINEYPNLTDCKVVNDDDC